MTDQEKKAKKGLSSIVESHFFKNMHPDCAKLEEDCEVALSLFDEVEGLRAENKEIRIAHNECIDSNNALRGDNNWHKRQISDLQDKLSRLEKGMMSEEEIEGFIIDEYNEWLSTTDEITLAFKKIAKALSGKLPRTGREELVLFLQNNMCKDGQRYYLHGINALQALADALLKGDER